MIPDTKPPQRNRVLFKMSSTIGIHGSKTQKSMSKIPNKISEIPCNCFFIVVLPFQLFRSMIWVQ